MRIVHIIMHEHFCLTSGSIATTATFGQGSGPVHLMKVGCTGTEANLEDCPSSVGSDCTHAYDAGVRCHIQEGIYSI